MRLLRVVFFLSIFVVFLITGCTRKTPRVETQKSEDHEETIVARKFATPQQVVDEAKSTQSKTEEFIDCFYDEDVRVMAGVAVRSNVDLVRTGFKFKGLEDKFKGQVDFLDSHDLADLYTMAEERWNSIAPKRPGTPDANRKLLELGKRLQKPGKFISQCIVNPPFVTFDFNTTTLENVVINEDDATGVLNGNGNETISFKKEEGSWKIRLIAGNRYFFHY